MKTYRLDDYTVDAARSVLLEQTRSRWEPIITDGADHQVDGPATSDTDHNVAFVSSFADPAFVSAHGPGLARVSDADIIAQALRLMIDHVRHQPPGKTGLPLFDRDVPDGEA